MASEPEPIETSALTAPIERAFEVPFELERAAGESDGLTFEGYASVFNRTAHIVDWDGEYDEVVAPGAFRKTISERMPAFMFNHGKTPMWEKMPIGKIVELREDARGLFVRARLSDNWLIHPIRDAIRDGAVSGMSVRAEIEKDTWQGAGSKRMRTIREAKLFELGPVTWPAYTETTAVIRSLEAVVPTIHVVLERDQDLRTPDEAAPGTSEEAAAPDEPAPSHSPSTFAERQQVARRIEASRKGVGKATRG